MRVVVIGTGYVGLVTGTCLAELGHHVMCVDTQASKIALLREGKLPIYEPGLDALVASNVKSGRLSFSTELSEALPGAETIFIAVGTPTDPTDGHADLTYVFAAAESIAKNLSSPATVVVKSTVPVGTGRRVAEILAEHGKYPCDVVSNPEFLREGSAVKDFMQPDRVVVGVESEQAKHIMETLYQPLKSKTSLLVMDKVESAELTKYACNAYLAMRISFVNEISDLCERLDANIQDVTHAMGIDKRIGPYFLKPGPGYGGSCFPKDTLALNHTADTAACPSAMVKAAIASNDARKLRMAVKIADTMGGKLQGKTIAILGLTFKANTDDMRDSPSLVIIPELVKRGAALRLYDPQGMHEAKKIFATGATWCKDEYEAAQHADAIVVLTEWEQFTQLDFKRLSGLVKQRLVIDLRAVLPEERAKAEGFRFVTVGKKEDNKHDENTEVLDRKKAAYK